MGGRKVQSPDGGAWLIRRRWVKWRPRWPWRRRQTHQAPAEKDSQWESWDLLELLDPEAILVGLLALAWLFLIFVVLPGLFLLLQMLIFVVVAGFTIFMRVLLRRPWIVEAIRVDGKDRKEWAVVGWWRSRLVIAEVAQGISLGHRLIQPDGARLITPLPRS